MMAMSVQLVNSPVNAQLGAFSTPDDVATLSTSDDENDDTLSVQAVTVRCSPRVKIKPSQPIVPPVGATST